MREPEAQDLSPLDPRSDAERWDRMVGGIMSRSAFELKRRQSARRVGVFEGLLMWTRPALATAAALAVLSLVALSREENANGSDNQPFIWSAALPGPVELWLQEEAPPSMLDMIVLTTSGEN